MNNNSSILLSSSETPSKELVAYALQRFDLDMRTDGLMGPLAVAKPTQAELLASDAIGIRSTHSVLAADGRLGIEIDGRGMAI